MSLDVHSYCKWIYEIHAQASWGLLVAFVFVYITTYHALTLGPVVSQLDISVRVWKE
jgi:hypothetical protein